MKNTSNGNIIRNEASQEAKTSSVKTMIHDGHVMQWFADDKVTVIGHGSQKVNSVTPKRMKKK